MACLLGVAIGLSCALKSWLGTPAGHNGIGTPNGALDTTSQQLELSGNRIDEQFDADLELCGGAQERRIGALVGGAFGGGVRHAPVRGGRLARELRAETRTAFGCKSLG